jgi:hypothetical protein
MGSANYCAQIEHKNLKPFAAPKPKAEGLPAGLSADAEFLAFTILMLALRR